MTEFSTYSRGEYKGFHINDDDCPVFTYSLINPYIKVPLVELKRVMIEMRNDGLVELLNAVDIDGKPNGSGWSITLKGLEFAVENNLIESSK